MADGGPKGGFDRNDRGRRAEDGGQARDRRRAACVIDKPAAGPSSLPLPLVPLAPPRPPSLPFRRLPLAVALHPLLPCLSSTHTRIHVTEKPTFSLHTVALSPLVRICRRMASATAGPSSRSSSSAVPAADLASFQEHLNKSTRILALLGAGLSASSGLPTFRGAGGLWRTHDATQLATPEAFAANPGLVWQFYSYRRHMALKAKPNPAHYALAELARKKEGFMTLSQNVDGVCKPHLAILPTPC